MPKVKVREVTVVKQMTDVEKAHVVDVCVGPGYLPAYRLRKLGGYFTDNRSANEQRDCWLANFPGTEPNPDPDHYEIIWIWVPQGVPASKAIEVLNGLLKETVKEFLGDLGPQLFECKGCGKNVIDVVHNATKGRCENCFTKGDPRPTKTVLCENCGETDAFNDHWDDLDGPNRAGWSCRSKK